MCVPEYEYESDVYDYPPTPGHELNLQVQKGKDGLRESQLDSIAVEYLHKNETHPETVTPLIESGCGSMSYELQSSGISEAGPFVQVDLQSGLAISNKADTLLGMTGGDDCTKNRIVSIAVGDLHMSKICPGTATPLKESECGSVGSGLIPSRITEAKSSIQADLHLGSVIVDTIITPSGTTGKGDLVRSQLDSAVAVKLQAPGATVPPKELKSVIVSPGLQFLETPSAEHPIRVDQLESFVVNMVITPAGDADDTRIGLGGVTQDSMKTHSKGPFGPSHHPARKPKVLQIPHHKECNSLHCSHTSCHQANTGRGIKYRCEYKRPGSGTIYKTKEPRNWNLVFEMVKKQTGTESDGSKFDDSDLEEGEIKQEGELGEKGEEFSAIMDRICKNQELPPWLTILKMIKHGYPLTQHKWNMIDKEVTAMRPRDQFMCISEMTKARYVLPGSMPPSQTRDQETGKIKSKSNQSTMVSNGIYDRQKGEVLMSMRLDKPASNVLQFSPESSRATPGAGSLGITLASMPEHPTSRLDERPVPFSPPPPPLPQPALAWIDTHSSPPPPYPQTWANISPFPYSSTFLHLPTEASYPPEGWRYAFTKGEEAGRQPIVSLVDTAISNPDFQDMLMRMRRSLGSGGVSNSSKVIENNLELKVPRLTSEHASIDMDSEVLKAKPSHKDLLKASYGRYKIKRDSNPGDGQTSPRKYKEEFLDNCGPSCGYSLGSGYPPTGDYVGPADDNHPSYNQREGPPHAKHSPYKHHRDSADDNLLPHEYPSHSRCSLHRNYGGSTKGSHAKHSPYRYRGDSIDGSHSSRYHRKGSADDSRSSRYHRKGSPHARHSSRRSRESFADARRPSRRHRSRSKEQKPHGGRRHHHYGSSNSSKSRKRSHQHHEKDEEKCDKLHNRTKDRSPDRGRHCDRDREYCHDSKRTDNFDKVHTGHKRPRRSPSNPLVYQFMSAHQREKALFSRPQEGSKCDGDSLYFENDSHYPRKRHQK